MSQRLIYTPKPLARPPREPEWGERAIFSAKASDDHVRRVFSERTGAVPARDEGLWGMLRACPKSWATAVGGAGSLSSARLSLGSSLTAAGKSVVAGDRNGVGPGKGRRRRAINTTAAIEFRSGGRRGGGQEGEDMLGIIGNKEIGGLERGV